MVWHEGAISKKSGKRYNGFWGCSNYPKCTETFKPNTPTPAEESFSRSLEQDKQQERIDKAIKEKKENIKWLNALNNATYLIARHDKFRILDEVEIK
jgi:ssDNA-binding Zn-finger/Zn-ribbon topoisomerase 1